MKKISIILLFLNAVLATAQVTPNPKIKKKSTNDVFINKIEITSDKTIVSMQYVAKTSKEALKEYLDNNPEEKEELSKMNPMMRNLLLQQMLQGAGGSTISFQSGSYLKTTDGKKFKFLKAIDIPTAPDRLDVEPGKKYFFKVYFEKLPKGYETIDLIESSKDKNDGFTYWNFSGISIINPAKGVNIAKSDNQKNNETNENLEFKLFGKVIDAETNKSISSKIWCIDVQTGEVIDSIQTSKSGYYEFLLNGNDFLFKISADGYDALEEAVAIGSIKSKGSLQKDIFIEPNKNIEPKVIDEKPEEIENLYVGEAVTDEKNAFKLDKVYFNIGEARVLKESFEQLDNLVAYLKENPDLKIQIEGHTDSQGDSKLNQKLSLDRAFNVREYLVSKGIESNRIKFVGYGDTKPISKGISEEARSKNRRVEYKIIE